MIGKFFKLDYIPNKLVYVYALSRTEIHFLAFFNEKGKGMAGIKHSLNKKSKRDLIKLKEDFEPVPAIYKLIEDALVKPKTI